MSCLSRDVLSRCALAAILYGIAIVGNSGERWKHRGEVWEREWSEKEGGKLLMPFLMCKGLGNI